MITTDTTREAEYAGVAWYDVREELDDQDRAYAQGGPIIMDDITTDTLDRADQAIRDLTYRYQIALRLIDEMADELDALEDQLERRTPCDSHSS